MLRIAAFKQKKTSVWSGTGVAVYIPASLLYKTVRKDYIYKKYSKKSIF